MRNIHMVFQFDSVQQALIINQSLQPELKKDIPDTTITINCDQNRLIVDISAKNTSALRAASNSYLRWIQTALNITNDF